MSRREQPLARRRRVSRIGVPKPELGNEIAKYPDDTYSGSLVAKVIQAQAQFGNSTHAIQIAHEEKSSEARAGLLVAAAEGLLARSSPTPPVENDCGNQ